MMKSLYGIVTQSFDSIKISYLTATSLYISKFSLGDYFVTFETEKRFDNTIGDHVIAAGTTKGSEFKAFSIYNLSTKRQMSCGFISNLFVALFAAVLGLFSVVITSVFLAPFSYVILIFFGISVSILLYRSFASLIAWLVVWRFRYNLNTKS